MKLFNDNLNPDDVALLTQIENQLEKEHVDIYKSYAGFPVLRGGKYSDKYIIDYALLTRKALYICNISKEDSLDAICEYQDNIYTLVETTLKKTPVVISKRRLICDIIPITISLPGIVSDAESYAVCKDEADFTRTVLSFEQQHDQLSDLDLRKINTALQGAYGTVKRERREFVPGTRSETINQINDYIEGYDDNQLYAISSSVEGIQRIRGMAGSGKTVILARKAAQLHIDHPDWNIVVTYSTRSQKNQLRKLIRDYFDHLTDGSMVDDTKLRVMHAWGSSNAPGLYYEICLNNEIEAMNLGQAKFYFHSSKDVYNNVCGLVLSSGKSLKREYDCILVDEAQDFKSNFFKMCLKVVKHNRFVYAYDELQNLGGEAMDSPNKLFGMKIKSDTPLRVCYRNQREVIVAAHALGMGIYSANSLPIQMPSTLTVWDSIGYNCEGELEYGKDAILYRPDETSPNVVKIHGDAINFYKCNDHEAQYSALIEHIENDLENDHLLTKDIMIIDLDTFNAEADFAHFQALSHRFNIHYAGKSSPEEFFKDNSVVYSSVFRAKGNEAFMVYIINAQQVINSIETINMRNALFTAMTRSKAWVNVLGFGNSMGQLVEEYNTVKDNDFKLVFKPYPTREQLKQIRTYNNDISKSETEAFNKTKDTIKKLLADNKRDPLLVAQELFGVHSKEELLSLLIGENDHGEK